MRIPKQNIEPGEWQCEPGPFGRLYRVIGNGAIEYEKEIDGLPEHIFFASKEVQRAQRKADEEREQQEAAERAAKRRNCPFMDGNGTCTDCKREACALLIGESCTLAKGKAKTDTAGRFCPLDRYGRTCRTDCALYCDGCALTNIFTNYLESEEK